MRAISSVLLAIAAAGLLHAAAAQQCIGGIVQDGHSQQAIEGATVTIKGTSASASTSQEGAFTVCVESVSARPRLRGQPLAVDGAGRAVYVYRIDGSRVAANVPARTSRAMLAKLGYAPHAVSSGEEALEYLKDREVDILLLDMVMDPGMNGLETYRRIIEIHPGAMAVIASGYSLSKDVVAAQALGAGVFIKKPYTLVDLGAALREVLRGT